MLDSHAGAATAGRGVVSRLNFDSGKRVKQGQLLLELDASVEKAQLASTRAKLKLAQQSLERSKRLAPSGAIPQAQLDALRGQREHHVCPFRR